MGRILHCKKHTDNFEIRTQCEEKWGGLRNLIAHRAPMKIVIGLARMNNAIRHETQGGNMLAPHAKKYHNHHTNHEEECHTRDSRQCNC